jgi:hypothetical protein
MVGASDLPADPNSTVRWWLPAAPALVDDEALAAELAACSEPVPQAGLSAFLDSLPAGSLFSSELSNVLSQQSCGRLASVVFTSMR